MLKKYNCFYDIMIYILLTTPYYMIYILIVQVIISYKSSNSLAQYGRSIVFFKHHKDYYLFIQKYESTKKQITDYLSIPDDLKEKLNELYPIKSLSQSFTIIPVTDIHHKCIEMKFDDYFFFLMCGWISNMIRSYYFNCFSDCKTFKSYSYLIK